MRGCVRGALVAASALLLSAAGTPGPAAAQDGEHFVPSRPETVSWGWFPLDKPPVLTIDSGETVRIDTLSHAGATQNDHPDLSLIVLGVTPDEILPDVLDFWASRAGRPREGRSGHVITGPIAIRNAEPGDVLEIQVLEIETRVPYGINNTSPTGGVFSPAYPGSRPDDAARDIAAGRHLIRTGVVNGREVALFADGIHVPLAPFMGIMAVAPDPVVGEPGVTVPGVQASRPPRPLRRQPRRQGPHRRQHPVPPGAAARRPVLRGRPPTRRRATARSAAPPSSSP